MGAAVVWGTVPVAGLEVDGADLVVGAEDVPDERL